MVLFRRECITIHLKDCFAVADARRTQKCHTLDWEIHKYECKALQRWAESAPENAKIPSDALRALGRMLWGFRQHGLDSKWVCQHYDCSQFYTDVELL